MSDAILARECM